jgi:hypothetical protein
MVFSVIPLPAASFGCEVRGLSLADRAPTDEEFAAIAAGFEQHGLVALRGQVCIKVVCAG